MSILLKDCWNTETFSTKLTDYYNRFDTRKPLKAGTPSESQLIIEILTKACNNLMNCEVMYADTTIGVEQITNYIEMCAFPMVNELRNQMFALGNDMGKQHTQIKFNPLDNDNIEDGTIATDNLSFNYAQNFMTNMEFLLSNNKAIKTFLNYLRRDLILVL